MIESHEITVTDSELHDPEKRIEFITVFGTRAYREALSQFAKKRLGPEKIGGMTPEELDALTQQEYEAKRLLIQKDLNSVADPKKPVSANIRIPETQLSSFQQKAAAAQFLGYARFMQAAGLDGLQELDNEAYHKVLNRPFTPYKASSGSGRSNVAGDLTAPSNNNRSER